MAHKTGTMLLFFLVVIVTPGAIGSWRNEWDFFTFAQAWPPGTCASAKMEHHVCHVPDEVTTWAVHGLWPSNLQDNPGFCNESWHFDFSEIAALTKNLSKFWPNLYNDTKVDSFWEHEWDKHGTCCTDLPQTSGLLKYFSMGLQLNQKFNITRMLKDGGVVPSDTALYSYQNFTNAIKKFTGFEPVIECAVIENEYGDTVHLISQIEICLTKEFTPRSCYDDEPGESYSANETEMKDKMADDGEEDMRLYFKSESTKIKLQRRLRKPQSDCPQKYNFSYPPIQHF